MNPLGFPAGGKIELLARELGVKDGEFRLVELGLNSVKEIYRRRDGRLLVLASGRLHLLELRSDLEDGKDGEKEPPKENAADQEPPRRTRSSPFLMGFSWCYGTRTALLPGAACSTKVLAAVHPARSGPRPR